MLQRLVVISWLVLTFLLAASVPQGAALTPQPALDLLAGATATVNGAWVYVGGQANYSIHVKGITTATVEIDGSNLNTPPAAGNFGVALVTVTADTIIFEQMPVEWIRARVTAYTSGTIDAYISNLRN